MATKLGPSLTLFPIFLCLFPLFILPSHSSLDTFIYGSCSQIKYTPNSPYESNLNSLLASLVNSATYAAYNNCTVMGSSPQDVIYGLYQCRGDLSMPDCAMCVTRAVSQFGSLCSQNCGGEIQLQGCSVKYDNAFFIGQEDKTVVMKKCGPSTSGYDADAICRRDAVLGSLGSRGGLYRVGGAQDVQGVAQCVGDLSVGQCQDCLSEAIRRLKSECGGCYGDMFLGTCYARYSSSGANAYAARSDHEGHTESGKTFAIIIGLLAGVTLIILLATFWSGNVDKVKFCISQMTDLLVFLQKKLRWCTRMEF